jgi:hypothetical protein
MREHAQQIAMGAGMTGNSGSDPQVAAPMVRPLMLATGLAAAVAAAACDHRAPAADPRRPGPSVDAARAERSRALFAAAGEVLRHPRCLNCHPDDDAPTRGDDGAPHDPPVARGDAGDGMPGLECRSCHQDNNVELARVPGAPSWRLAPRAMAWRGRSLAAICAQLKDPARNGGRTLAQIVEHAAHDPLVAWGWAPGPGRAPAPGTQADFGATIAAWVESGAECPREEAAR